MKIFEVLNEGGWEDTITQKTKLTPSTVKKAIGAVSEFVNNFNTYLGDMGIPPVKMGSPTGSSAYFDVDDETVEYGDIDLQMIAPDLDDKTTYQLADYYNKALDAYIAKFKPSNIHDTGKPTNGHPIFKVGNDYIQVDMLWGKARLADWDRWRKTPHRGIKGLIYGNIYSSLGEIMDMSLQSAVQVKMKDGEPVSFRSRKGVELVEVTDNIRNFGVDILKFIYNGVYGSLKGLKIDPELKKNPGLKTEQVNIADLLHTVKGLAKSFEHNDLYGKFNLKQFSGPQDFLQTYASHYLGKAKGAGEGAKLDKATTPEELAKVQELRDKIAHGVAIFKKEMGI
jgi:hypothetical protein